VVVAPLVAAAVVEPMATALAVAERAPARGQPV